MMQQQQEYPVGGYPQQQQGYPQQGYPQQGYPQQGYPQQGYPAYPGVVAPPMNSAFVPFIPYTSDGITGIHPAIQSITNDAIRVVYRASFQPDVCCSTDPKRKYFMVTENSYELNLPMQFCCGAPNVYPCSIPENLCCPIYDMIYKSYFDSGLYDQRGCCRYTGCIKGTPSVYSGEIKYVFCCMDCGDSGNSCLNCYWPDICGDRLRYVPAEYVCCCFSTRATCNDNCMGLFGIKTGEPKILFPVVSCLKRGTGEQLAAAMESSRQAWKTRTGLP